MSAVATQQTAKPSSDSAPVHPIQLLPVHTCVPGRARFKVAALYRAERLQELLETQLRSIDGIHGVQANAVTGSLLIHFDPTVTLTDLGTRIEEAFTALPLPPTRRRPTSRKTGLVTSLAMLLKPRQANRTSQMSLKAARTGSAADPPWHALSAQEVIAQLDSAPTGLSATAATQRLARLGANILPEAGQRSDLSIFLEQFASPPVALLGVSALVSIATSGALDAAVIASVVLINAFIGFFTERQSEKIIASLAPTGPRLVSTLRDKEIQQIAAETLVPGDVIMLRPGSLIAADARLLQAERLSLDESALTGESMPVDKQAEVLCQQDAALGDRHNMVYMGTAVTGGSGTAIVVGTGLNTEIGRIHSLAESAKPPETAVERQLDEMGTQLVWLSSSICGVVFLLGLVRGQGWLQMLKTSISLAVAAVPEGLPTVATTTLAIGIRDMRKHNVLVRQLNAVETLGAVQVFCLDKTGTLTLNHMTVVDLHVGMHRFVSDNHGFWLEGRVIEPLQIPELHRLLEVIALCNELEWQNGSGGKLLINGSATEMALMELAIKGGLDISALQAQHPRLSILHRAKDRPYMVTTHSADTQQRLVAVKGNPEQVLELCRCYLQDGKVRRLVSQKRAQILRENERMAGAALRVLGVAYALRDGTDGPPGNLVWLGLVGMADPLRPGMVALLNRFHRAGIATSIITGDQSATAYAIAKQLDLADGRPVEILDSVSLDKLDPALLSGVIQQVQVFSRVSPAHKLQIVQALQRTGKVVAMTGDGINDGPALKAADLGVAMGGSGTEVARSVADIVVEDDNLTTMVMAIRDGRAIYSNIRKATRFLLATNLSEIMVMLTGVGLGLGQPLTAMQLLWINLATDIFPGLALAMEPPEPDILERPPRDPQQPILSARDLGRLGLEATVISGGTLASYGYALLRYGPGPKANTHTFMTLTLAQLFHALSSRSEQHTLLEWQQLPPNRYLNIALGASLTVQSLTVLLPSLRSILGTTPLGLLDSLVIGTGALLPLLINESTKKMTITTHQPSPEP